MALNEMTDTIKDKLPPTDSRLRPDSRLLEEGQIGTLFIYLFVEFHEFLDHLNFALVSKSSDLIFGLLLCLNQIDGCHFLRRSSTDTMYRSLYYLGTITSMAPT